MKYEKLEEGVWALSDILSVSEYDSIEDEFIKPQIDYKREPYAPIQSCYWIGHAKPDRWGIGDNHLLISIAEKVKFGAMRILQSRLKLERVNTNIQFKLNDTPFHVDGPDTSWTFLIFFNEEWDMDWGGDFIVNYAPNKYRGIPYIPDTGVLFNADMPHRGCAGNILSEKLRFSIAFTYAEV